MFNFSLIGKVIVFSRCQWSPTAVKKRFTVSRTFYVLPFQLFTELAVLRWCFITVTYIVV
jgi:hypothetical protein